MSDTLGYRKTGKDSYEPIVLKEGYIYTAAIMCCGKCGSMIAGMGGPGSQHTLCMKCFDNLGLDHGRKDQATNQ